MLTIRYATEGDAAALFRIAEQTFRATFEGANSSANMDLHCRQSYGANIQAAEIANPSMMTLLCEGGKDLVGFAQLRSGEPPCCVTATPAIEIQRLYVANEWHGKGVAQVLMTACLAEASRMGSRSIWLGVWEHNPRAINFYMKCGFAEVGAHSFPLGSDQQRDLIMVRSSSGEAHAD